MALVTYPLNDVEYSAEDVELFHVTRTSGIYAEESFGYSVTGNDNTIVIGSGIGWIKNSEFSGKVVAQKEPLSLDLDVPNSVYPRIDAIVIRFDANSNETNIVVRKGTATSSPVAPSVIRTESVYELHLYHVRREVGSLSITARDITDLRLNSSYCGLMSDSVTTIDTTAIENQFSALLERLQREISNVQNGTAYLPRDGSSAMVANLPMGGNKVTNLGDPSSEMDAVNLRKLNATVTAASAVNLLDNSNFAKPVNQRGGDLYVGAGYTIDRWKYSYADADAMVDDGFLRLINNSSTGLRGFSQVIPAEKTPTAGTPITVAYKVVGDGAGIVVGSLNMPSSGYRDVAAHTGSGTRVRITAADEFGCGMLGIVLAAGGEVSVEWIALYVGSYSEDSLPEFRPKDYGAEVMECQRYYQVRSIGTVAAVDLRPTMRIKAPTVTVREDGNYAYSAEL